MEEIENEFEPELGWCIGYKALKYHMEDALAEKKLNTSLAVWDPAFALFTEKYYNEICKLNHDKIHDFCFIGSIWSSPKMREWVIKFAKTHFTENSVFVNTDHDPEWKLLGPFDYSNHNLGYCPKNNTNNQSRNVQYRTVNENKFYFETMCQSKFVLCPAGDAPWSFRFYEVLMCKSLPLVESFHHTYRSTEESKLKYKYALHTEIYKFINNTDPTSNKYETNSLYDLCVNANTEIFKKNHLL
jgi:hypothetical protein